MDKLLFAEDMRDKKLFKNKLLFVVINCVAELTLLIALGVFMILSGDTFFAVVCFVLCAMPIVWLALTLFSLNRYILIYGDRIVCKSAFGKEKIYSYTPDSYTLKIHPVFVFKARQVSFVFENKEGETILRYKSSLVATSYDELKKLWESDLFSIGCRIIDETWELKK